MSAVEALRHPVETFRTAPYAFSLVGINAGVGSLNLIGEPDWLDVPFTIASPALAAVIVAPLVKRQFRLRRRTEEVIEHDGFDREYFEKRTDEWCARQTIRFALEDTEHMAAYEQLCEEQADTAAFSWLPHI